MFFLYVFHSFGLLIACVGYLLNKELLKRDIEQYSIQYFPHYKSKSGGGGYFKRMAKILIKDFAFRAVFSYRLNNYKVVKSLFNFLWRPPKTIEISAISKNIGGGLWISHNYCVLSVFSAGVNLRVGPGVTVGMKNKRGESVINPIIGDNVWICTNATILGGIKIGENSIIGAGAVVTKDVPANSIVVGNPAYLLYKEKAKD